jgi:hypothetical protein
MAKAIIAKRKTSKPTKATQQETTAPLDRYDPRVRALASDLLREVMEKDQLEQEAERKQKEQSEKEATEKRRAEAEAEATRPLTMDEVLTRMRSLVLAAAALNRANNFYSGARGQLDTLQPFVNTPSPERSFGMLESTARTAPSLAASVMGSVPGTTRQVQAATIIDRLGRATPGNQNSEGSAFSTNTFLTNWNKLPDQGKAALINGFPGADGVRPNLNKVAQTAEMIKNASGVLSNPSGTAGTAANIGALSAAGTAAFTGHPMVAAGILGSAAVANVAARSLTNPIFANWLAQSTQVAPSRIQQHINRLAINATAIKDPQTEADVLQFVNSLRGELGQQPMNQ